MFTTQASFPKIMKLKITKPPVKLTATYKYLYLLDSNNVKPNLSKNATFSNCYLAVPRQTLGHFSGNSLPNPTLIMALSTFSTQRS